jgi:hypothetical protein
MRSEKVHFTTEALLDLHDEAFVVKAYAVILGRVPDPEGLRNYLAQVRSGTDRAKIVAELALSPEGRLVAADLPGLSDVLVNYGRTQSLAARLRRGLVGGSIESAERQIRILENRLYLLELALAQQTTLVVELLMSQELNFDSELNASRIGTSINDVEQPTASPRLSRTFVELKSAIVRKQRDLI